MVYKNTYRFFAGYEWLLWESRWWPEWRLQTATRHVPTRATRTLLVCLRKMRQGSHWLVALSCNGSEWHEAQRVQTDGEGIVCCALSDSRVLIGGGSEFGSKNDYLKLFRVESCPHIGSVHRIHVPEQYLWFSETCNTETLVAMS